VLVKPQQLGLERRVVVDAGGGGGGGGGPDQMILPTSSSNSAMRHSTTTTTTTTTTKATEKELQYPLESATSDFPWGWTKRIIPRENASSGKKMFDTYYYSPVHGYKFRSRPEVRLFLDILDKVVVGGGDETIAMEEYRREKGRKRSERKTTTTTTTITTAKKAMSQSTAMDEDEKEPPLNRLHKEMGERKRRQNSLDDSEGVSDATSTADDENDDDDAGKDAIDWYDGKILSFQDGNFVVYFLGDAEDVTYTMPLTPKIVRPSVRAWTKRTLALLSCDIDLTKEAIRNNEIANSLPPSTSFLQDDNEVACALGKNGDENNHYLRLLEYGKLLETQLHLAEQLSPHADDDQSGGNVDGEDEGPGPFANKSYVKHLCICLEESKKVCDWLIKEVDAMNLFKRINDGTSCNMYDSFTTAPISKDSIQSFLVNGTTFLQRILALIPIKFDAVPNEQNARNGRKRRRANTHELSAQRQTSEHLLPNISVSPDSLDEAMNIVLHESGGEKQQLLMTSTLKQILSVLYLDFWKPHQDWIQEAEYMIYGKSTSFYSFQDIESHIQAAQKLAMFDISSWRIDLEAKLNRARFFEMEAWSAIKACTTLDGNGGNTTLLSDSCLLALNRLQNEVSSSTLTAGEQSIMRNMNPLGKQSVSANGAHSLTRDDIENAIKTRQWILDLMQAKTSRERASFVQVSF
jgi:hypothetical protein